MNDIEKLFKNFAPLRVGIVGDVMLDTYMWGTVERISPEAPVPVVCLHEKEQRIGGAGNVALNVSSLGAAATILSVTGQDEEASKLSGLLNDHHINTHYLVHSSQRITTNKIRIISRNQQMMRLDNETTAYLRPALEKALLKQVNNYIKKEKPDIIIFEDYNKGVLTEKIITEIISLCKKNKIITAVDPKRKNFFAYKGIDIYKPNLKEVKEGLNLLVDEINIPVLKSIHQQLQHILHHKISLITLSEKGIFYQQQNQSAILPSHIRSISDVSGAGDTVIAVAALVYAATRKIHLMAEVANIAGGLVCEEVGTVAINKERLLRECELLLS